MSQDLEHNRTQLKDKGRTPLIWEYGTYFIYLNILIDT